jgi:hypothetical protein
VSKNAKATDFLRFENAKSETQKPKRGCGLWGWALGLAWRTRAFSTKFFSYGILPIVGLV